MHCKILPATLLLAAFAFAQPGRVVTGIVYRDDLPSPLALDLYLPPGPGPHPLAVCMHGGGWHGGFRWYGEAVILARALVKEGVAVASVTYRLAPKHRFPAQIEDVRRAIQFLRLHAGFYRLDPHRVAAIGASSGGHLAALLGTQDDAARPDDPDPVARQSTRVRCVVGICAPLVFEPTPDEAVHPFAVHLLSSFLGVDVNAVQDRRAAEQALAKLHAASPWHAASKDDPPFFLVAGGTDTLVPPSQSRRMARRLTALDVPAEVMVLPEYGHCNFILPILLDWRVREVPWWDRTRLFLLRHLIGTGPLDERFAPRRPLAELAAESLGPASWSRDGESLALINGRDGRDLRWIDVASGREPRRLRLPVPADRAAPVFSAESDRLLLLAEDAVLEVAHDDEGGLRVVRRLPLPEPVARKGSEVRRLAIHGRGQHLAFEAGGSAWLLRLRDGRCTRLGDPGERAPRVLIDAAGQVVVTRFEDEVPRSAAFDLRGRRRQRSAPPLLELSANGSRRLVLGDRRGDGAHELRIETGDERRLGVFSWRGDDPSRLRARWSADGRLLVVADADDRLTVRDGLDGKELQRLPAIATGRPQPIALRPDGREILSRALEGGASAVPFLWRR